DSALIQQPSSNNGRFAVDPRAFLDCRNHAKCSYNFGWAAVINDVSSFPANQDSSRIAWSRRRRSVVNCRQTAGDGGSNSFALPPLRRIALSSGTVEPK